MTTPPDDIQEYLKEIDEEPNPLFEILSKLATPIKTIAPEHGAIGYKPVSNAGVVLILPRRIHRVKAQIWVNALAGQTLWFNYDQGSLQNASPQGASLSLDGSKFEWKNQRALYCIGITAAQVNVYFIDEGYQEG